jgi:hypothetical protein
VSVLLVQLRHFVLVFVVAVALSLMFHFYCVCLRQARFTRRAVFWLDFLFWAALVAVAGVCLFFINAGELRGYVWLAFFCGGVWYYRRFSRRLRGRMEVGADCLAAFTRKSFRVFFIPLHKIRILTRRRFQSAPPPPPE